MPSDEDGDPDDEAHPRREQERERPPQPAHVRERDEEPTRQEEDGERPAHGDERERDAEIGDEHVLEHVHRLQVLLADRVDRADEREDGDRHTGAEEDGAAPRRQIGATPRRSRWKPWKKNTSATTAPASTSGESVQVVHGLAASITRSG